jgi:hypothetical protein
MLRFRDCILGVREKGRHGPGSLRILLFRIEEWARGLLSVPRGKCQIKLIEQWAGVERAFLGWLGVQAHASKA